jgi:DNA-binding transcriptional LysR family regulator
METISRHLDDLLAFHLVATEGGFTRAAEALGTSKAAVSKQVARLEALLSSQLFWRSTRSVRTTEAGEALLEFSRRILDLSEEAGRKIRELHSGEAGIVRISTPVSLGEAFFPSFLETMQKQLPKVTFDTDLSNEFRDVKGGGFDFALRGSEETDPDLVAKFLGKLRDVICAAPLVARKLQGSRDPQDLTRQDCILSSVDPRWNAWTLSSRRQEIRVQVQGRMASNEYGTARLYALHGLGVARLPYYLVAEDLAKGRLIQLYPEFEIATHVLHLVYLKGTYSPRRQKIVRDGILDWFRKRPEIFI